KPTDSCLSQQTSVADLKVPPSSRQVPIGPWAPRPQCTKQDCCQMNSLCSWDRPLRGAQTRVFRYRLGMVNASLYWLGWSDWVGPKGLGFNRPMDRGGLIVVVGLAFEARIAAGPGIRVICSGNGQDLAGALSSACAEGGRNVISFGVAGGLDPSLRPG